MATETQIVKEFVAKMHGAGFSASRWARNSERLLRHFIQQALTRDDLRGGWDFTNKRRERQYMAERLEHRIRKKLGQPFRRKDRGPLRAKGAGKNEVTRRR